MSSVGPRPAGESWEGEPLVEIVATDKLGSAVPLNGLHATVLGPHPLVAGWVKIRLKREARTFQVLETMGIAAGNAQNLVWSISVCQVRRVE